LCGSGATPMATLTDADIGRRVSVTNSAGEVFQGTVFTVDSGVVMLEQFTNSNTAVTRANYTMVNAAAITNVAEVAPAPSVAADHPLPPPDAEYLRAREERAIARATAEADNINVKASTRFQAVYDALSKTMPCEWGSDPRNPAKVTVLVLGNIIITSELDPNKLLCAKGEERLKERVQKVLTGILTKLESDPRMASSFKSGEHPEWM